MSAPPPPFQSDVGSLAEEAERLVLAAQDWARRTTERHHLATGAPECQGCPLCQAVAFLRGDRPEMAERAGEAVKTTLSALTAAFTGLTSHREDTTDPTWGSEQ